MSKRTFITIWACFTLLLPSLLILAAENGTIEGTVRDAKTGEPLAGANIVIIGTGMGAASNLKGEFIKKGK